MFRTVWKRSRVRSVLFLGLLAVLSTMCSDSPTGPSSNAEPPPNKGSVRLSIDPNPVPHSGVPVTDEPGCAELKNTWFYDQIFEETGGTGVTFTARIDSFDGFVVNNLTGLNIVIPPLGTLTLHARWCSGNPIAHTALSTFSGVDDRGDAVTVTTPTIRLQKP
jgi:hypothetical protein